MLHPRAFLGFPLLLLWFSFAHTGTASTYATRASRPVPASKPAAGNTRIARTPLSAGDASRLMVAP